MGAFEVTRKRDDEESPTKAIKAIPMAEIVWGIVTIACMLELLRVLAC